MKKSFIILFLLFTTLFSQTIKIATYNVENLFDGKNNGNEYKDFKIGISEWSEQKYIKKLANIKDVLLRIDADIVALEEIENEAVLKELIKDTDYRFVKFRTTKNAPIGLGIISKLKIEKTEYISVVNTKTRDILKATFKTDNKKEFNIFVNHFPAYKNGIEAQKKAQRALSEALKMSTYSIALGDFNTPFGKNSILNPIEINQKYKNLWREVDHKNRYSFCGYGKKRAIDHVLLSPEFMQKDGDFVYVCRSFYVFKDGLVDKDGYSKTQNGENLYSDHLPLVFEISTDKNRSCGLFSRF